MIERTTPEWATTSAGCDVLWASASDDLVQCLSAVRRHRRTTRRSTVVDGSSSHPGQRQLDLVGRHPFPLTGVRLAQPGVDQRFAELERLGDDRRRSARLAGDRSTTPRRTRHRARPARDAVDAACSRPSAVSGESAVPCQRRLRFHTLWPCRSTESATDDSPTSRRRVLPTVRWGRWQLFGSSLRHVTPPAPAVTNCPVSPSATC